MDLLKDDLKWIDFLTHNPITKFVSDADSLPTVKTYKGDTDTPIETCTVVKRSGLTGHYRVKIQSDVPPYQDGQIYNAIAEATVNGITAKSRILVFWVREHHIDEVLTGIINSVDDIFWYSGDHYCKRNWKFEDTFRMYRRSPSGWTGVQISIWDLVSGTKIVDEVDMTVAVTNVARKYETVLNSGNGYTNNRAYLVITHKKGFSMPNYTLPFIFYIGEEAQKIDDIKAKTDTIDWTDIDFLKNIRGGKWEIVNNQIIYYKADNSTEVCRFNLFDSDGNPAMERVYKRERV